MSEREFMRWVRFASTHRMPSDRIEAYLARIAYVVAQTQSTSELNPTDFLLNFSGKAKTMTAEEGALTIANFANGPGVRKLGQGRKKKAEA